MKYLIINGAGASKDICSDFPDGESLLEQLKKTPGIDVPITRHNPSSIDLLITKIINQKTEKDFVDKVKKEICDLIGAIQDKIKPCIYGDNYFFDIIQNHILVDNVDQLDVINFNYDTMLEKIVDELIRIYKTENDEDENRKKSRIEKLKDLRKRLEDSHIYGYITDDVSTLSRTVPNKEKSELYPRNQETI